MGGGKTTAELIAQLKAQCSARNIFNNPTYTIQSLQEILPRVFSALEVSVEKMESAKTKLTADYFENWTDVVIDLENGLFLVNQLLLVQKRKCEVEE